MADAYSTSGESAFLTQAEIDRLGMHKPFSWLDEDAQRYPLAKFVEQVKDMTAGIALTLEIVEMADIQRREALELEREDIVHPVIQSRDAFTLRRFAIAASRMLNERSSHLCDWLSQHGAKAVREGRT